MVIDRHAYTAGVRYKWFGLDEKKIDDIRKGISSHEEGRQNLVRIWEKTKSHADSLLGEDLAEICDWRIVCRHLEDLLFVYKITEKNRYLEKSIEHINVILSWENFSKSDEKHLFNNLVAGHAAISLGMAVNWLSGEELDASLRVQIAGKLYEQFSGRMKDLKTSDMNYNNHYLILNAGIYASGITLCALGEHQKGRQFMAAARTNYEYIMDCFKHSDGVNSDGLSYSCAGIHDFLVMTELLNAYEHYDMRNARWFADHAVWVLYSMYNIRDFSPGNCWCEFGDAGNKKPMQTYAKGIGEAAFLLELAHIVRESDREIAGMLVWMADRFLPGDIGTIHRWLNVLLYENDIEPVNPDTILPDYHCFPDHSMLYLRSGNWSSSIDNSLIAYSAGPLSGLYDAEMNMDVASGHAHFDSGQITLIYKGVHLLRDDGYCYKSSAFHNTAVINGEEQNGAGRDVLWSKFSYPLGMKPRILYENRLTGNGLNAHYAASDLTQAYNQISSLTLFKRHILYIRPCMLAVIDEIDFSAPGTVVLNFHTGCSTLSRSEDTEAFILRGENADKEDVCMRMRLKAFGSANDISVKHDADYHYKNENLEDKHIRFDAAFSGSTVRNISMFTWGNSPETLPDIDFDWEDAGRCVLELPDSEFQTKLIINLEENRITVDG